MRNTSPASKNPFLELDSLYAAKTGVRKNLLVVNADKDLLANEAVNYSVTFTLLPHQILVLPNSYLSKITNTTELTNIGLQGYTSATLLYVPTFKKT